MALQYSVSVRNAQLNGFETATGTDAKLSIRTGAQPGDCSLADSGALVVSMTLPTDWMNPASGGTKTILGVWSAAAAGALSATPAHFRIYASDGTTCHAQGTVTATGNGGDMTVDNINIAIGQTVTVTGFTLTAGNA